MAAFQAASECSLGNILVEQKRSENDRGMLAIINEKIKALQSFSEGVEPIDSTMKRFSLAADPKTDPRMNFPAMQVSSVGVANLHPR